MYKCIQEEINDIKYNIFKLLMPTRGSSQKFIRKTISRKFHSFLVKHFNLNGRYRDGDRFLQRFEIPRKRKIEEGRLTRIGAFQMRVGNPKKLHDYTSQPQIGIRFIRLDDE